MGTVTTSQSNIEKTGGSFLFRPYVEALRGLASILVLLFHFQVTGFENGYLGVDMFFVLSGFLIGSITLLELHGAFFDPLLFIAKRFRRLLPVSLFVLLLTATLAKFKGITSAHDQLYNAALLYYSNVFLSRHKGDYFSYRAQNPVLHYWSLSIEEQFYFCWACVLTLLQTQGKVQTRPSAAHKLGYRAAPVRLLLVAAVASVIFSLAGAGYFSSAGRAFEILFGVLGAACNQPSPRTSDTESPGSGGSTNQTLPGRQQAPIFPPDLIGSPALVMLLWVVFFPTGLGIPPSRVIASVSTLGVIWACESGSWVNHLLSFRPVIGLGKYSYALYLWHFPVSLLLPYFLPGLSPSTLLATKLGATVLLTVLSFHFLEQPLKRVPIGRNPGGAVAASLLAVLVAQQYLLALFPPTIPPRPPSLASWTLSSNSSRTRVLLAGDSAAWVCADGWRHLATNKGFELVEQWGIGCTWISIHNNYCPNYLSELTAALERTQPTYALLYLTGLLWYPVYNEAGQSLGLNGSAWRLEMEEEAMFALALYHNTSPGTHFVIFPPQVEGNGLSACQGIIEFHEGANWRQPETLRLYGAPYQFPGWKDFRAVLDVVGQRHDFTTTVDLNHIHCRHGYCPERHGPWQTFKDLRHLHEDYNRHWVVPRTYDLLRGYNIFLDQNLSIML